MYNRTELKVLNIDVMPSVAPLLLVFRLYLGVDSL